MNAPSDLSGFERLKTAIRALPNQGDGMIVEQIADEVRCADSSLVIAALQDIAEEDERQGPAACDHCGSENVTASLEPVRPHGKRIVTKCGGCGTAWINTEPSVTEKAVTALLEAKEVVAVSQRNDLRCPDCGSTFDRRPRQPHHRPNTLVACFGRVESLADAIEAKRAEVDAVIGPDPWQTVPVRWITAGEAKRMFEGE